MDRRTAQMEVMKTPRCAPVLVQILISADLSPTDVSVPFESVMVSPIVKGESRGTADGKFASPFIF